jgi:hypothetical protein
MTNPLFFLYSLNQQSLATKRVSKVETIRKEIFKENHEFGKLKEGIGGEIYGIIREK